MRGARYQQQTILSLYKVKMIKHRIFKHIALFALLLLTACQSDETTGQEGGIQPDGKVRVRLNVGVEGSQRTRAWQDGANAVTAEMMNVWTVVAVNNADNKVVSIYACKPSGEPDQEIDNYVELPATGTYRFYSFANMSPKVVMSLLGISGTGGATPKARTREGNEDPTTGNEPNGGGNGSSASAGTKYDDRIQTGDGDNEPNAAGTVTSNLPSGTTDDFYINDNTYQRNKFYSIAFTESVVTATSVENKTVNVAGNNFDVTANDNGFGAKGIPMSNIQTITVSETTDKIELIVVRMMAKIEVDVYNDGADNLTIEYIKLMDVTRNVDNNLKLLPSYGTTPDYPGDMEYHHKDLRPNLGSGATKANLTLYPTSDNEVAASTHTMASNNPVKFIFYVNESTAPTNGSGLFYLVLGIKKGSAPVEYRHALINQKGKTTTDDDAWDYIARNDYRIIPVVLTDWQFRIEPIAFVPIAGYPAVTLSSDALKATFSTGGFIALQPYVKKRTDTEWRDFSNPEVKVQSVSWKTKGDATENPYGDGKMIKTKFAYDSSTHYIIGELNNNLSSGTYTTAVTVTVKLGPDPSDPPSLTDEDQYIYSFTCDVILQVP